MSNLKLVWMGLGESGIVKEGGRNRVVKSWNSPPVAHGGGRQSSQALSLPYLSPFIILIRHPQSWYRVPLSRFPPVLI